MERKPIERTKQGQYVKHLEGMREFTEKVAKELCERYPDVDFFDMQIMFERDFNFAMSMELLKYGSERNKDEDKPKVEE